jgi:uncharacterized SAM-binding protein YcdF (DUF218 family)
MGFALSKALWYLAQPSSLLLIVMIAGALIPRGGRLMHAALAALAVLGLTPAAQWLTLPLEERFPRPDIATLASPDAIIVLGGMLDTVVSRARGAPALNEASERLTETVALARRFPDARIIFSGGSGDILYAGMSESDVARRLLRDLGVQPERVIFEDASRTTAENARLTRDLIAREGLPPAGRYLLVTSAFHMPRSVGCFRQAGVPVIPFPVDHRTRGADDLWRFFDKPSEALRRADVMVKEWAGLFTYWLRGDTSELWPGP